MRSIVTGGLVTSVLILYLVTILISLAISVGTYVFESIGLYKVAERRTGNEVLAWIPFARKWLLGRLADQFEEKSRGKKTYYRTILLWSSIAPVIIYVILLVVYLFTFITMRPGAMSYMHGHGHEYEMLSTMLPIIILLILYVAASIACLVFYFIALYKFYKSCDEKNAVLYLVLSIFVGITRPIFIFVCRKKDSLISE